jgi:ABC-type sulfate transport system substrate-binding protein
MKPLNLVPGRRALLLAAVLGAAVPTLASAQSSTLLNVSYDVAREFYKDTTRPSSRTGSKAAAASWPSNKATADRASRSAR